MPFSKTPGKLPGIAGNTLYRDFGNIQKKEIFL
jgi:hypothetical protein